MLDREYAFFSSNKDSLFSEYPNQYVIIIGEKVIKAFGTLDEAYAYAASKYEPGTFFIEQCTGSIPQQIFHSRVVFA